MKKERTAGKAGSTYIIEGPAATNRERDQQTERETSKKRARAGG